MEEASKRPGPEKEVELPARKKGKKGKGSGKEAQEAVEVSPDDYVRVVPYRKATAEDDVGPRVLLSKLDRAPQLQLSEDRCSVTGSKGFRTVRATHGAHVGTYYCEATVQHLGPSGHCRLGWSTKKAEINAPVGYDQYGVGYRDVEGSKVHKALREEYGEAYGENDVIGLFIHLPEGGRSMESRSAQVVRFKGMLYQVQDDETDPKPLPGSVVGFSKNGVWQGVAYMDLLEGTYYPSVSLFTLPEQQSSGATVALNFGPDFKYPAPSVEGCPAAEPVSVLPAKAAAAEAAAAAELVAPAAAASGAAAGADATAGEQPAVAAAAGTDPPQAAAQQAAAAEATVPAAAGG